MPEFIFCIDYCICLPICRNKTYLNVIEDCAIIKNKIKRSSHTLDCGYCKLVHFSFSPADFILNRDGNTVEVGVKHSDTGDTIYFTVIGINTNDN